MKIIRNIFVRRPSNNTSYEGDDDSSSQSQTDPSSDSNIGSGTDGDKKTKGLGVTLATLFIVAEIAGAGILNISEAILNTGWGGIALLVAMSMSAAYVGTRLGHAWIMIEELWPEFKGVHCRRPYPTIGYYSLGNIGKWIAEVSLILTLFGCGVVYLLVCAELINALTLSLLPEVTFCSWTVITCAVLIPCTWFGSLKDAWAASIGATVATIVAVFVVVVQVLIEAPEHKHPHYPQPTLKSFFLGFGSILFSLGGASTFPTIQLDMTQRERFPISVYASYLVLFLIYGPVGIVCYVVLGDEIQSNILMSVDGVAIQVTQGLLLAHFLFAFTIAVNPMLQEFEEALKIPMKFGIGRILARTFIMGLTLIIGLAVPKFSKILDLIGGSTITVMSFVLPPVCYLALAAKKDDSGNKIRNVSKTETVILVILVIIGISGGIISTISAVSEITAPGAFNSTCFSKEAFISP